LNFEANVWSLMLDLGEIDGGGGEWNWTVGRLFLKLLAVANSM
jgi:hypothetical protein